ncbi:hypothetical protein [Henriciella marina]|uniref:hypothetical protein n=1 Tax=Henriciella marina TaxID=453851 RepID=UPI000362F794|nr:hypothetical protein [Henriciella marina]
MTRDFVLGILGKLPVWLWPVFLWDVAIWRRWLATLPEETAGLLILAVTRGGRIVVANYFDADKPAPADWTRHAPRAPWLNLEGGYPDGVCGETHSAHAHASPAARPLGTNPSRAGPAFIDTG